ncbi:MAG: hypothetical protein ATN35_04145 [Epulopiscium sp. Nele67-Bin004]|nr:MAG: hypothetical protein ATN35_04145 [Epulopiscium sp. Nele67-Bin004]
MQQQIGAHTYKDFGWGVDPETINFEKLIANRLKRHEANPSKLPRDLTKLIYKDIPFKTSFGVIVGDYNPIENSCAFANTIFRAINIDFKLNPEDVELDYIPKYNTVSSTFA